MKKQISTVITVLLFMAMFTAGILGWINTTRTGDIHSVKLPYAGWMVTIQESVQVTGELDILTQRNVGFDGGAWIVAHDTLAGRYFYDLAIGNRIPVLYEDGTTRVFVVTERTVMLLEDWTAILDTVIYTKTGEGRTLGYFLLKNAHNLVLMTCFNKGPVQNARLVIIARPLAADELFTVSERETGRPGKK